MSEINTATMLQVGTVLHGTYRIESYLSSGGFGNTYVASKISTGEKFAIKELYVKQICFRPLDSNVVSATNSSNSASFCKIMKKFKKEASRLSEIDNEHIVKVYAFFEENGTAYYVMDLIEGPSLGDIVKVRTFSSEDIGAIFFQLMDALQAIHDKNIWHLDIKPENLLLTDDGILKLIDFGSSKHIDQSGDVTTSTAISYTNGFAAPELFEGNIERIGPWTDLYAVGATLYKLSTGNRPPSFSDIMLEDKQAFHFLDSTDESLEKLVLYLMSPNINNRPKSCKELMVAMFGDNEDTVCATKNENKSINGHETVDLGLSVYWASMDIGANETGKLGDCFLWGDPDGSKTHKVQSSILSRWLMSGPSPSDICGNSKYDTAMNLWGGTWRMPRKKEVDELISECSWEEIDGNYVRIIGPNGNSIYLDCRLHWTGNSNNNGMILYAWEKRNEGIFAFTHSSGSIKEDYVDCFFPIRPVASK